MKDYLKEAQAGFAFITKLVFFSKNSICVFACCHTRSKNTDFSIVWLEKCVAIRYSTWQRMQVYFL